MSTPEFPAGSEMGALIHARDWSKSPLGDSEGWPKSLRSALLICLHMPIVSAVHWGPDLRILYNDAYALALAERHPWALGQPFRDVWAEIWDVLGPQIASVIDTGIGFSTERQLLKMNRRGRLDDTWWVYSFAPLYDDDGRIGGIFVTAIDETDKVLAEQRLSEERERQRRTLQQMPGFVSVLHGPEHRYEYVNDAYRDIAGDRDFIGRTVRDVFPELEGQGFFALLDSVYATGKPFTARAMPISLNRPDGERFIDLLYEPIRDEAERVTGIFVGGYDVTERRQTEERLAASERDMRFALKAGRFGAWELDLATNELTTSEICRRNFGRSPDSFFSYAELRDAIHPDDRTRMTQAVARSIATGADYDIEYRVYTPEHEVRWVLIRGQPSYASDGTPLALSGVSIDITDRKRDEARRSSLAELSDAIRDIKNPDDLAHAAAALLGRTLGVSRVGYATIDPDAETLHVARDWNAPGIESLAGVIPLRDYGTFIDSLKRGEFISISDVRDDERTAAAAQALEGRSARSFVNMPVIEQGRLSAVLYVNHAEARAWSPDELALIKDVGERTRTAVERIRTDIALSESEMRYRTLFESVESGFCVFEMLFDDQGRPIDYVFVEVNPAFEAQTGLVDAVGRRISELAPGHEQRWYDLYGKVALSGTPLRVEEYAQALGRWYEIYAYRVGEPEQRRVAALFNDVSERKHAEARIRELNETLEAQVVARTVEFHRFRDIVEATTAPICAFDTEYRLIAFNRAHNDEFRRVNGFDTKLGDVFPDLFIPKQQPIMRALMSRALSGEQFTVTEEFGRPEFGQPAWEISYTPLRDESGAIIGAFHLATDISDRLRAEADLASAHEQLRQSQKMEAMGSLTGGVAHDFNNLLTPIVGTLDLLQRREIGGERERRLIAGAVQSAERATVLVQRLLAFARRQPLQSVAVHVTTLIRGMADLVSSTLGPQIDIVVDVPDELPAAKADPNQLEMALLNLAVNARDAMPQGGRLTIAAKVQSVKGVHRANLEPGQYVRLSVVDTGTGMDEATLNRAIEPFFSTKGVGKGTGLGLSMVHGLAAQLGGGLSISSQPGRGTKVELWLPVSAEAPEPSSPTEASVIIQRSGVALLVDDEDLVRSSTADMLADLGYAVVEAGSTEEAVRLLGEGLVPDLVVTDHLMPGMSGTDLVRRLRADRPNLPALVVSGYADVEGVAPDLPRLVKPFRQADLAAAIAELVAG